MFESLSEALCVLEMTSTEDEDPAYRFVEVNAAFFAATGLGPVVGTCGDVVLKQVAQRLTDALRSSDTLARMHGDEFVVLLPEVRGRDEIASLTTSLLTEVTQPVDIADAMASVTASIGVSLFPNNARHARGLMHAADAAMYQAKAGGKNTVRFYGAATKAAARGRRSPPADHMGTDAPSEVAPA